MGTDISPGLTLVDGQLVHDADLNTLVSNATILSTAISAKTLKPDMSLGDEFLVNDSGTLKKVTGQQIVSVTQLPSGVMMDYAGATEPLGWVFCYGQALSRTTYAALFTAIGTAYGVGDGSTTFNVPDFRGRVTVGKDDMGGTASNRITSAVSGFDAKVLGNQGGSQSHLLVAAETPIQVPAHTHPGVDHLHSLSNHTHSIQPHHHLYQHLSGAGAGMNAAFGNVTGFNPIPTSDNVGGSVTDGPSTNTTGAADRSLTSGNSTAINIAASLAHRNLQPTIIVNKIIKT